MIKPPAAAPITDAAALRSLLAAQADPARAESSLRFFKSGPGQYGEGLRFWGLSAPQVRAAARAAAALSLQEVERLLEDPMHEARSCGLLILVEQFRTADEEGRRAIIELYLRRTDCVDNWDLVDCSAGMLGQWLADKDRGLLRRLADSDNLWEQRMAVVATLPLIKSGDFTDILTLVDSLKKHPHDLMHKAMGWMLREVGKKDRAALEAFLEKQVRELPRTTLRYAIERFPQTERKAWLKR